MLAEDEQLLARLGEHGRTTPVRELRVEVPQPRLGAPATIAAGREIRRDAPWRAREDEVRDRPEPREAEDDRVPPPPLAAAVDVDARDDDEDRRQRAEARVRAEPERQRTQGLHAR